MFSFDSRNSFVRKDRAKIFGFKLGKEVIGKHRWGIGFYSLADRDSLHRKIIVHKGRPEEYRTRGLLKFSYIAFFYDRIIFSNKRWEFSSPWQFGIGGSQVHYISRKDSSIQAQDTGSMFLIEPTLSGQYKPLYWLGLGIGVGYRVAFIDRNVLNEDFNSPIYALRVKVFLGEIYRKTKNSIKTRRAEKKSRSST